MQDIKPGYVVQLRSGGPDMTVESVEDGVAKCVFWDSEVDEVAFDVVVLDVVDDSVDSEEAEDEEKSDEDTCPCDICRDEEE